MPQDITPLALVVSFIRLASLHAAAGYATVTETTD